MGCLCFGKSAETINERRSAKRQAADLLMECARKFPKTANGGEAILSVRVRDVAIPVSEFWAQLSPADRTTLATGKGCNTRPPGATNYMNVTTLRDFLRKGAEHPYRQVFLAGRPVDDPEGVHCWGGYVRDGYLWAQQVMRESPNAFAGSTQLDEYVDRVRQAEIDQDRDAQESLARYVARPTWPPSDREESTYYGAWLAGECFEAQAGENTFVKVGKIYVARWADRESLNRARSAFTSKLRTLEEDLRTYIVQVLEYEFDDCFDRWVKWYRRREVPLADFILKSGDV